jgi:uncharacterized membrane protein YqjE
MRRGRSAADQQRLRSVLMMAGGAFVVAALCFLGYAVWLLVAGESESRAKAVGFSLVVAVVVAAMAVACIHLARDDGRGQWCDECLARNLEDAQRCENCGSRLG